MRKRKRHCLYPYFLTCQILPVSPSNLIGYCPRHQGHKPVFRELLFHFVLRWPFSWLSPPWFFCYDSQPHLDPKSHPLEISPISKKHSLSLPNGSRFSYFALPFIGHTTVMHILWIFVHIQDASFLLEQKLPMRWDLALFIWMMLGIRSLWLPCR